MLILVGNIGDHRHCQDHRGDAARCCHQQQRKQDRDHQFLTRQRKDIGDAEPIRRSPDCEGDERKDGCGPRLAKFHRNRRDHDKRQRCCPEQHYRISGKIGLPEFPDMGE